jgi:hypothetical protein
VIGLDGSNLAGVSVISHLASGCWPRSRLRYSNWRRKEANGEGEQH